MNSSRRERGAAGRNRRSVSTGAVAFALRAHDHRHRAGGDHRRHAVGGGGGVAQVAGQAGAALDLLGADQVHRLHHAGPGGLQRCVRFQHRARRGGTDDKAVRFLADADHARDVLGIDDQFRLQPAGPELDQKIGPAGQRLGEAGGTGEQGNGLLDRRGRGIIQTWHVRSWIAHGGGQPWLCGRGPGGCVHSTAEGTGGVKARGRPGPMCRRRNRNALRRTNRFGCATKSVGPAGVATGAPRRVRRVNPEPKKLFMTLQ